MQIEQQYIDAFWSKVDKTTDCWNWRAAKCRDGYGLYGIRHIGQFKAHRFSLMLSGVSIPKGYVVMHRCDNPSCVNPEHLKPATVQENNKDKQIKGRQSFPKGTANAGAKLTDDQVRDIKARAIVGSRVGYNNGSNIKEIAAEYNVIPETVRLIARGHIWKHINGVK